MTRRQRLEAVINGNISEELIEDCKRELEKLNAHSARAKKNAREEVKKTANYKENKVYEEKIVDFLDSNPRLVDEIGEAIGGELSRQKVTAICTNLVREGRIRSCEIKVKNKGKRKAYYV